MSGEDIRANLPIGCDKEWADWVVSLYHENPANLREAVERIACEAIVFGGDMGPDGNTFDGADLGIIWSESTISWWVHLVYVALQKDN